MKLLVFSDSHGSCRIMADIIKKENPDIVIHLGDTVRDIKAVEPLFEGVRFYYVPGNNDYGYLNNYIETEIGEKKFFICHGHQFRVKSGLHAIMEYAKQKGADILLFGHTHTPLNDYYKGMLVLNPGSIKKSGFGISSYGVIILTEGEVFSETKNV